MPVSGPNFQGVAPAAQAGRSNLPQVLGSLTQRLRAFNAREEDRLDQIMAKKAKEQGRIDAQGRTAITLRTGETIADNAWNEGATASYAAAVKLDLTENLTRIHSQNALDPVGFKKSAKAYSAGIIKNADPAIRPYIEDEVASSILAIDSKINAEVNSLNRKNHAAQMDNGIQLYESDAANKAASGDIEGATEAQMMAQALIDSQVNAGMIEPKVAEKRKTDLQKGLDKEILLSAFQDAIENGASTQFLMNFAKQKEVGLFTPDERRDIQAEMLSNMSKYQKSLTANEDMEETLREGLWDDTENTAALMYVEGNLSSAWIKQQVLSGTIDPKIAKAYTTLADETGPRKSDWDTYSWYEMNLLSASKWDIMKDPALSHDDRRALVKERDQLEQDTENWRSTQNGKEAVERINRGLKIPTGMNIRMLSKDEIEAQGNALTELYNTVQTLPLTEREAKAIEVADKIVSRFDVSKLEKEIEASERLIKDRIKFRTFDEIDASDLGEIEKLHLKQALQDEQLLIEKNKARIQELR